MNTKIALIDCFSGISGDMLLGAFIDLGVSLSDLKKALSRVSIGKYILSATQATNGVFAGTRVHVAYSHTHHEHISYKQIIKIIKTSRLSVSVKRRVLSVFDELARAEAKVHGKKKHTVCFHEVGAVDSLVDIIGVCWCVEHLKLKKIFIKNLSVGTGCIKHGHHGVMPVPAPATLEILKGYELGQTAVIGELITPTGAAFVKVLGEVERVPCSCTVNAIGYGIGTQNHDNHGVSALRVSLGEVHADFPADRVLALETNIDDMHPQAFEVLSQRLFETGALDVFVQPIMMKKQRPAYMLTVLFEHAIKKDVTSCLFAETSSFGVRFCEMERYILDRKIERIKTKYGYIRVKRGSIQGVECVASPEYADVKQIMLKRGVSFRDVYQECVKTIKKRR